MRIYDDFQDDLSPQWMVTQCANGTLRADSGTLRMAVAPTPASEYSNAQITDYDYQSFRFCWRPPVKMTVTAWATGEGAQLRGTAGFGFWNHPFSPDIKRPFSRPQAVWFFFASPPNNMALAKGVPGTGWKAATINAKSWPFLALLPLSPLGLLLMRVPALYNALWPIGQRAIGVSEHLLDGALLAHKHVYALDWRRDGITFAVDGSTVHETDLAPRGPLGFIAWLDNQYAVVTPQGQFRSGLIYVEREQALILQRVEIQGGG